MANLRDEAEHARRTTGHPLYKNERQALIQIAKRFGYCNITQRTKSEAIYLAIMDSLGRARGSRAGEPDSFLPSSLFGRRS